MSGGEARASFYPLGFFENGQSISGSTILYGDIEFRGQDYARHERHLLGLRGHRHVCAGRHERERRDSGRPLPPGVNEGEILGPRQAIARAALRH